MSKNIDQIFTDNPITSNEATDLMYFGQSPYGPTDDAAMEYSDFSMQFSNQTFTTQAPSTLDTIVLTSASNRMQVVTGNAQLVTVNLPASNTLPNGAQYTIVNASSEDLTIAPSGFGTVATLIPGANIVFSLIDNTNPGVSAWSYGNGLPVPLITSYVSSSKVVTVTFGGGSPGNLAVSSCSYTKINAMVFVLIYLNWTNKTGASTGDVLISGLPYASTGTGPASLSICDMRGVTFVGQVFARVNQSASTASILQVASAGSATVLTDTAIGSTALIQISGVYQTNS